MITAGIDVGAVYIKIVLLNSEGGILVSNVMPTGADSKKAAQKSMEKALNDTQLNFRDISYIISTGYSRINVPFATRQVTEITCHARGAHFLYPDTRIVIDIGGQDCKAIQINDHGEVMSFVMNDKCAAGTGRFLEEMARALEVRTEDLGELSLKAIQSLEISSMCTVFAESEIVSLIASAHKKEDIIQALHKAVSERVVSLANKLTVVDSATLTGGVINNIGVVRTLKEALKVNINIPPDPQIIGALGAALIAMSLADQDSYLALYKQRKQKQYKI